MSVPSKTPRAAIVGLGGFGEFHAKVLSTLTQEGACRFVGGCDPNIDAVKTRAGFSLEHLRLFKTYEELLEWGEIDYIVIASPPHLHLDQAKQALDRGLFIYLEKPPAPTFWQVEELLKHPGSDRIAVGFQLLEADAMRTLKAKLNSGELGELREVLAGGLWPRITTYYNRAAWAGKMQAAGQPIFDGPLTNALAHIVHNVFFLAGKSESEFAVPQTVSGIFARARPIESYDFAWVKGVADGEISFNIVAGHCSKKAVPWTVCVRTDRGVFSITEKGIPPSYELLESAHRSAIATCRGERRATTTLADCLGYNMATTAGLISSSGIHSIPANEITMAGDGGNTVYHVERIYRMVEDGQKANAFTSENIPWLKCGAEINCRDALAVSSPFFD